MVSNVQQQDGMVVALRMEKTCTFGLPKLSLSSLVSRTSLREKKISAPISWLTRISAREPRTVLGRRMLSSGRRTTDLILYPFSTCMGVLGSIGVTGAETDPLSGRPKGERLAGPGPAPRPGRPVAPFSVSPIHIESSGPCASVCCLVLYGMYPFSQSRSFSVGSLSQPLRTSL